MNELQSSKIKELRLNKGWKLRDLAQRTGISATSLSQIERGGGARPSNLKKIADALGVDVQALIKGGIQEEEKLDDKERMSAERFPFRIASEGDPFAQAVSDLREIFNSGDDIIITALQANLYSFKRSVRREVENQELKAKIQSLEARLAAVEEKLKGG